MRWMTWRATSARPYRRAHQRERKPVRVPALTAAAEPSLPVTPVVIAPHRVTPVRVSPAASAPISMFVSVFVSVPVSVAVASSQSPHAEGASRDVIPRHAHLLPGVHHVGSVVELQQGGHRHAEFDGRVPQRGCAALSEHHARVIAAAASVFVSMLVPVSVAAPVASPESPHAEGASQDVVPWHAHLLPGMHHVGPFV